MLMSGRGSTVALAGLVFWLLSLSGKTTRRGDGGGLGWGRKRAVCRTADAANAGRLGLAREAGVSCGLHRRRWRCSLPAFQDDGELLLCEEVCARRIAKRGCGILKTLLLARGGSGGMRVRTWCDLSISPCLTAAFDGGGGGGENVVYWQV